MLWRKLKPTMEIKRPWNHRREKAAGPPTAVPTACYFTSCQHLLGPERAESVLLGWAFPEFLTHETVSINAMKSIVLSNCFEVICCSAIGVWNSKQWTQTGQSDWSPGECLHFLLCAVVNHPSSFLIWRMTWPDLWFRNEIPRGTGHDELE